MMQAEKVLRDAGWVETVYGDLGKDDEFFHLPTGSLLVGNLGILNSGDKVLRAPRPEPEYELGTVARVRVYSGEEFNALMDEYGFWLTVDGSYQSGSVDVLRVVAYPDGSTPTDQAEGDRHELIEGMVPCIAKWGHRQMRTALGRRPAPLAPGGSKASEEKEQHWKEWARIALHEAYDEATK